MERCNIWGILLGLAPGWFALALDNAALIERGARVELTCDHPKPLNERWHKAHELLREKRFSGPIINDLRSARLTVFFPVALSIVEVGLRQGDYKGGFARAKEIVIHAPGSEPKRFTLENKPGDLQSFPYRARADRVTVSVRSIYPPDRGPKDRKYGGFTQVRVLVSENLDEFFATPESYSKGLPTFVMLTPNLEGERPVKVIGKPRKAVGHPCTIWDKEDISELKAQIEKYPRAREAYERILSFCEKVCAEPLQVPEQPDYGTNREIANRHTAVAQAIANLGIGYALSGNERYAREAKRLLLELAKRYEGWPIHRHPKFTHDSSKWSWQRLGDAIWLIPSAWGFDLIYQSASLSDAERQTIIDHFIMPCVRNIMRYQSIITAPTNWSAVCAAAVMIGARVSGNRGYYEKSYLGLTRKIEDKRGGFFFHLDKGIDDDGMWAEGAIGYQFMAMCALVVMAEILWHDGIDSYGYRNGRLKRIFDSPIWYCYPGGRSSPAIHDSGSSSLFGRNAHLYQYAKRRYGDRTYDSILCRVTPTLESVYNLFLPACDFAPVEPADLPRVPSILFPGVGFAILRTGDAEESKYLLLDYGPARSHGHPDKLNFCLYALEQELFADAGSAWYATDIYKRYYSQTLAHNTVFANGTSQIMTCGRLEAYGSLGEMALIRASCDSAIPSTILDRTLLLSENRLYDIYMVVSGIPFTFELPYHCHGKMEQSLTDKPWNEWPRDRAGYCYFKNPLKAEVHTDWRCVWVVPRGRVEMHAIGEPKTELIFTTTPKGGDELPTAILRRKTRNTIFASAFDIVRTGQEPSLRRLSGTRLPENRGYALRAELADRSEEIVISSFREGTHNYGEWRTDARIAFAQLTGGRLSAFYIAGGTKLEGPQCSILSSDPTLLAYRIVKDGLAELANQGENGTRVRLHGVMPYEAVWRVNRDGKRISRAEFGEEGLLMPPRSRFELTRGTQPTVAEYTARIRREKLLSAQQREEARRREIQQKVAKQYSTAKASAVPKDFFVLIQAENFKAQGGGKVVITDRKVASYGKAFLHWDNRGHWLEYEFSVPQDGYYKLLFKYCREGAPTYRALQIDGEYPCDEARKMEMPGTGGWSNGADNWQFYTLSWELVGKPYLIFLKGGKHTLRIENVTGDSGLNLDYILLTAPFMQPTRQNFEK